MKYLAIIICFLMTGFSRAFPDDGVKVAVDRALPYLEEEGNWWIEKKKCTSCHHSTFLIWAKDLALEAGYEVDNASLKKQRDFVRDFLLSPIPPDPKKPEEIPDPDAVRGDRNVEGVSQLLLSASAAFVPEETKASLVDIIRSNQGKDGNWKPGGQLPMQDRPKEETQWVSNQWMLAALRADGNGPKAPTGPPGKAKTNEWYAMNVVLEGSPESIQALLSRQNDDGGWSWIDGENSSPTGTGQALFALARTNEAKKNPGIVERARNYLLSSQTKEGHWETLSTKDRAESTRVSNFWGTAWAVIGLLESE
jgi:squalene-hopene/tetraprenyl-beta-curcumene cyclase